jgi:hypothetical protein
MTITQQDWNLMTSMPGCLPEGDAVQPYINATPDEALDALLDEAAFQCEHDMTDECLDGECLSCSDEALIAQYRRGEGRADALFLLGRDHGFSIWLESYANGFGATVELIPVSAE